MKATKRISQLTNSPFAPLFPIVLILLFLNVGINFFNSDTAAQINAFLDNPLTRAILVSLCSMFILVLFIAIVRIKELKGQIADKKFEVSEKEEKLRRLVAEKKLELQVEKDCNEEIARDFEQTLSQLKSAKDRILDLEKEGDLLISIMNTEPEIPPSSTEAAEEPAKEEQSEKSPEVEKTDLRSPDDIILSDLSNSLSSIPDPDK